MMVIDSSMVLCAVSLGVSLSLLTLELDRRYRFRGGKDQHEGHHIAPSRMLRRLASDSDANSELRSYEICFGLLEGYDTVNGKRFGMDDAEKEIKDWILARWQQKMPILTGHLSAITMIYPIRHEFGDSSGSTRSEFSHVAPIVTSPELDIYAEPCAIFKGALTPMDDRERTNEEVIETLRSLAVHLGKAFNQVHVFYSFLNKQYTVNVQDDKL